MTEQHPLEKARITRDRDETGDYLIIHDASPNHPAKPDSSLVERVAQWGYEQRGEVNEAKLQQARDQELEACIAWFDKHIPGYELVADKLRAARRPKPPSLKERAWKLLECYGTSGVKLTADQCNTILRALEDSNG